MNDHLKRELYNLGQFAHHGACNAALVYIAKLEQALAEASKDAERYRWLRDKANYAPNAAPMAYLTTRGELINWDDALIASGLDDAIDAAIKENQHE